MAGLGNATITVLANTANFENSLRRSIKRIGLATAALGVGVGLTSFLQSAISDSIALEKEIAKIKTIVQTPVDQKLFNADKIREFSNAIGQTSKEVTDATYLALSSGVAAKDAFAVVEAANHTAVSTASDMALVVDFTTSALNAFADSGMTAAKANDTLFKALQYGKGTMNDFAKYISTAIPIADQLGVGLEQLASLGAVNTLTGASARKVFTGLKVAMQELSDSTKGGGKAFMEMNNEMKPAGQTFQDYIKKTGDLAGAFAMLTKEYGGKNLTNIFGAKEGAAAIQSLATLQDKIPDVLEGVAGAQGAAKQAFEDVDATLSRQIDRLKVYWANYKGSIGDALGPATKVAVSGAMAIMDGLRGGLESINGHIRALIERGPEIKAWFGEIWATTEEFRTRVGAAFGETFREIGAALPGIIDFVKAIIVPVMTGFAMFWTAVLVPFLDVVGALATALGEVGNFLAEHETTMALLGAAIAGVVAGLVAFKTWALVASGIATVAAFATGGWATAFWALNAAMYANPIGAVVAVVVALAAAFIYAWRNSESFREITVKAINGIKDAMVTGVSIMWRVWTGFIRGWIEMIKGAANLWSKLPKVLGGGDNGFAANVSSAANFILSKLSDVQRGIDSLKGKDIHLGIQVKVSKVEEYIKTPGAMGSGIFGPGTGGSIDLAANGQSAMNEYYKDQAKNTVIGINSELSKIGQGIGGGGTSAPLNFGDGSGSGGGGGGGAAGKKAALKDKINKAAEEAKRAAERLREALKEILRSVGTPFVKELIKKTASQIDNELDALAEKVHDAYKDMKTKTDDRLIASINKANSKLQALATRRDAIADKLKAANDKVTQVSNAAKSFASLSGLGLDLEGKAAVARTRSAVGVAGVAAATAKDFVTSLQKRYQQIKDFRADLDVLSKKGLSKNLYDQLAAGGVEESAGMADALAKADATTIKQLNDTQANIDNAALQMGKKVADVMFDSGAAAGKGFLTGLKSQQSEITKLMTSIANSMVATIKKSLKIKSPSRVFFDLGDQTMAGFQDAVVSSVPGIHDALQNAVTPSLRTLSGLGFMAGQNGFDGVGARVISREGLSGGGSGTTVTFGPGAIVVSGVDANTAQKVGQGIGQGILGVITQQRNAAALAGTGG